MGAQMGLTLIPVVGASYSPSTSTSIRDHFHLHDQGHRERRATAALWVARREVARKSVAM